MSEISSYFFHFAPFEPFLRENKEISIWGIFVVVGNKCHIVWKIQISIIINSEGYFV
jgi:hypothetical protein